MLWNQKQQHASFCHAEFTESIEQSENVRGNMFEVGTRMTVKPIELVKAAVFSRSADGSKLKTFQGVYIAVELFCAKIRYGVANHTRQVHWTIKYWQVRS